ncbi:LysM peptidoglycan-binding domain-containing protein [Salinimicrobium sp. GXAS 041]|uniref:amino acid ABC transporter substrate-binding protein n=1 Tax=Salinimicrobium sp. GXAS 041 TaxID=3400806 RepID=UPI003C71D020
MKRIIVLFLFFQMLSGAAFAQQYKYHIVEEGETVESVARKYNTTKEAIYQLNPDARNGVRASSKLVVPIGEQVAAENNEVKFETHRVRRKETLFSLSQQYNVEIEDIRRYNKHLYSEELRRGEKIRIPISIQKTTEIPNEKFQDEESPANILNLSAGEHVVLPQETMYGISRKYNLTIEELEELNPGLDSLRPGMILKISTEEDRTAAALEDRLFKYYQVQPQETLFSLTRRFGISKDSLIVLNPALADGLKSGMVLKIPNLDARLESSYAPEENIVNLENSISNYETKNLVVMLPFNLNKITQTDTSSNAQQQIKRDKVLQISLDFYSGVLMAIDSAKAIGLSSKVQIFDTQQSVYEVNNIINTNDFSDVDAVVGPILQSTAEAAAGKLRPQGIPVISPLTKRETSRLENFYQSRPTDEMLTDVMISYLSENSAGKNFIIVADGSEASKKQQLISAFPGARVVTPKQGNVVDRSQLASVLVKERSNWVILESNSIGVLSNTTSYLNSLADDFDITLFTTNKNNSFESDNISNRHLSKLHFHYPSVDKEYERSEANAFVKNYSQKYGVEPNRYAVRGFDVTYDILLRLASSGNLTESMEADITTEYVENKFSYGKTPTGGYLNRAIYIMSYDDDMTLKVVR